jgi:2,4-dienoyl-CoA reductase-like NADH-dependent reductase (Old Yellow Enzyme family)
VADALQPNPISASDVQLVKDLHGMTFAKPRAASSEDIRDLQAAFVHCAVYLEKAGFDGIQLHAAHGYLLAQFLSLTTNRRDDKYGGSLENRARMITEIGDQIRAKTRPNFVLSIKINSVEFQEAGFTPEEAAQLCELLEAHAFDFVELSGGTYEHLAWSYTKESTRAREAFFLEFAETITPHLKTIKSYITGGLRSVGAMVDALNTGVDGIGLGRPCASEPRFPQEILSKDAKASIKPIVGDEDVTMGLVLSGAQMRQIGHDQEPLDPSNQESIDGFMKDLGAWMAAMTTNDKGEMYGYAKVESLPVVPYIIEDMA